MFAKNSDGEGYVELLDGISIKTLVHGEKSLTAKFRLVKGAALPLHKHPHEQTGYLLSGRMKFVIDGAEHMAEAGDSWSIAGNIMHGAEVIEDSIVLEVFTPVRADYLPDNLARRSQAF